MKPKFLPLTLAGLMAIAADPAMASIRKPSTELAMTVKPQATADDVLVVAKTLWAEARGEGETGMRAVASVIYNRAHGDRNKFAAECKKKYQFSCWTGKSDITVDYNAKVWSTCMKIAKEMFTGKFTPTSFGGEVEKPKFYCTSKLFFSDSAPTYIKNARKAGIYDQVGNHVFYNV